MTNSIFLLPIPAVDVLDLLGGRSCMMPNCDNSFLVVVVVVIP